MSAEIKITYGEETVTMVWDSAQASAPITVDGESTPYQTADARHSTAQAVRLAARYVWPEFDFADGSEAWGELSYETATAYTYTVWDGNPNAGMCTTLRDSVEIEAYSDDEAIAHVVDVMESIAAGLDREDTEQLYAMIENDRGYVADRTVEVAS